MQMTSIHSVNLINHRNIYGGHAVIMENTQSREAASSGTASRETLFSGVPTRSDTNRAVRIQKMARG